MRVCGGGKRTACEHPPKPKARQCPARMPDVIDGLITLLDSIPPVPGADIVQLLAGVAVAVFKVYEDKCFNDAKVNAVHVAIAQVSEVLQTHVAPRPALINDYGRQLRDVQEAVRAAGQWVAAYAKKSAMSKYFTANKERLQAELTRSRIADSLTALNMALMVVASSQIDDMHSALSIGHATQNASCGCCSRALLISNKHKLTATRR